MYTGANQTLEIKLGAAHTTNASPWTVEAVDTALVVTPTNGTTNGATAVTIVAASKGFLKSFLLRNADTVVSTLTVQLNDNSTLRPFMILTLAVGDIVTYDAQSGWRVFDSSGKLKTQSTGDWLVNTDGSVSLNDRAARASVYTLTYAATITPDFAIANNFECTLTGGATLANPTNLVKGQSGNFRWIQDSSGGRTLAYGTYYDFIGGSAPTISTAANAVDLMPYYVASSTSIIIGNPLLAVS